VPVALLKDGTVLQAPTPGELAGALGLSTQAELSLYDLVVIGAGPAGSGAAVYGGSEGLRTLLVEREAPGGQAGQSSRIENYLGFPNGLSGQDLARRAAAQVRKFNAEVLSCRPSWASRPAAARTRSSSATATRCAPTRSSCRPASPTASSTRPASPTTPARASTTARR
jgi:alkyl hydroperoxide reductase subunit AhpF